MPPIWIGAPFGMRTTPMASVTGPSVCAAWTGPEASVMIAAAAKLARPRHVFASIVLKTNPPGCAARTGHAEPGHGALDAPRAWQVCGPCMNGVNMA